MVISYWLQNFIIIKFLRKRINENVNTKKEINKEKREYASDIMKKKEKYIKYL